MHHDAGIVGAALTKDVWKRRLELLKEGGCNAIRIAHNPASCEFLDFCDVVVYSYKPHKYYYFKKTYSNKAMMGTENVPRLYEWKAVVERDFIPDLFLWTGVIIWENVELRIG
ncbi:hypothetical protein FHR24_002818 [Wenyingzhuangia heitensis]|uniref:Glycoside hydrolase family 2 catalytic domain-containing protein n=1 Tax=Wenyingzhuangia heitensis TaxID=1487859 RepID=A0ABX0UBY0_9FLAO|nr:glycoside hydrolase family 2 TIM barrel-domain containing protein [Wenyingzhuangia heitensis]NIJ46334.1 hypothetical protein [Wenyingzhuangia heitensis]